MVPYRIIFAQRYQQESLLPGHRPRFYRRPCALSQLPNDGSLAIIPTPTHLPFQRPGTCRNHGLLRRHPLHARRTPSLTTSITDLSRQETRQVTARGGRQCIMGLLSHQPGQHDRGRWSPRHAPRNVTDGHSAGNLRHSVGWRDGRVGTIPSDEMRTVSGPRIGELLCAEPDHIPECCGPV